jgi:hypothetical protein
MGSEDEVGAVAAPVEGSMPVSGVSVVSPRGPVVMRDTTVSVRMVVEPNVRVVGTLVTMMSDELADIAGRSGPAEVMDGVSVGRVTNGVTVEMGVKVAGTTVVAARVESAYLLLQNNIVKKAHHYCLPPG